MKRRPGLRRVTIWVRDRRTMGKSWFDQPLQKTCL
jgi:hypothetical protein